MIELTQYNRNDSRSVTGCIFSTPVTEGGQMQSRVIINRAPCNMCSNSKLLLLTVNYFSASDMKNEAIPYFLEHKLQVITVVIITESWRWEQQPTM